MPQGRSAVTKPEQGKGGDIHLLETVSCRSSSAGHVAPAQHTKPCFLNGNKSQTEKSYLQKLRTKEELHKLVSQIIQIAAYQATRYLEKY